MERKVKVYTKNDIRIGTLVTNIADEEEVLLRGHEACEIVDTEVVSEIKKE